MTPLLLVPVVLVASALATPRFDASSSGVSFTGAETWTQDGGTRLWSVVERQIDPEESLFRAEAFSAALEWPANADWAPWIDDCFGTRRPHSSSFLLHVGLHEREGAGEGTPILFVPGAADNGSRAFVTLAAHMDALGRPVYALTFAHPHGDLLMQAEVVADAIARIRARTGAAEVDVVGHSKGAIAAAIYASNHAAAAWGSSAYDRVGTRYRGDVRRLVLVAPPLGGLDTVYRWPSTSLGALVSDAALWPSAWQCYYPYGTASGFYSALGAQDLLPEDGDLFPGQRQLTLPQAHPLPGSLPWLGARALQQDWWTTWYGGLGYVSWSEGIDAAVDGSGDLLGWLEANGVDPDVEITLLAGNNPLLPTGGEALASSLFGETWAEVATGGVDAWAALLALVVGEGLASFGFSQDELQGLASGDLVLGEITGPSDGLVFLDSAQKTTTLTGRGARVGRSATLDLSHLDLLYASPVTGALMEAEAAADPVEYAWMGALGRRYATEDSIGWIEAALAEEAAEGEDDAGGEIEDDGTVTLGARQPGDPDEEALRGQRSFGDLGISCATLPGRTPTPLGPILAGLAFLAAMLRRIRESNNEGSLSRNKVQA
jgi:pimeloyl-ACP methyl ester carboxylesterase